MTCVKHKQVFPLTYQLGKLAGTRAPLVSLGTRFLLLSLTGTTFQSEARPVTQNIGRTAKKTIGGKREACSTCSEMCFNT